jgi:hypothetical protein
LRRCATRQPCSGSSASNSPSHQRHRWIHPAYPDLKRNFFGIETSTPTFNNNLRWKTF